MRAAGLVVMAAGLPLPAVHAAEPAPAAGLIVERTNAFRQAQGLSILSADASLESAAAAFAGTMARTGQYGHTADGRTPVERASAQGYEHCIVSENIAYQYRSSGFETKALAAEFVQGWKNSPEHRKNMLDPAVTQIGVGLAQDDQGRWFAVQMFGRPKSAAIRFSVRNAGADPVHYRVGDRQYTLGPRVERTHMICRTPELYLPDRKAAVTVRDGATFTVD